MQSFDWMPADWKALILAIRAQRCTPFLGAGACYPTLPLGGDVAEAWAKEYEYPFPDRRNLARVSQYMATKHGSNLPKFLICERLSGVANPCAADECAPHRLLASLRLPIYLTTNYDNFMSDALALELGDEKRVQRILCGWHTARVKRASRVDLQPSQDRPVVFHLHGHMSEPSSIVITEDDYLEFLMLVGQQKALMPACIESAFGNSAFLFVGYSLEDMNFRIIFSKLATYLGGNNFTHAAVQLTPRAENAEPSEEEVKSVRAQVEYLRARYQRLQIKVFWGTADQFATELSAHYHGDATKAA
jgi:hypothetical protein